MKKDKVDKLTDKAFFRLIITSVLAIVFCLFCLCSTTWAWFTESQESTSNSIKAANCTLEINISEKESTAPAVTYKFEEGEKEMMLTEGVTYFFDLKIPETSASGYCIIKLFDGDGDETNDVKLYSQSVSNNGDPYKRTLTFKVVAESSVRVEIIPCWGIYSGDNKIMNDDTVTVSTASLVISSETVANESESESGSENQSESDTASESEGKSESIEENN